MANISKITYDDISESEHQSQLRRAVIAATIGTAIEWYDFFLYSVVTGLVFAKLYFPHSDPLVGTLDAFAIYAVGFLARPIGAAIFGHYGDRIGRKATLVATLLLMGTATFAVAFVPTYNEIGVWGAIILTVLRFIQGIGVGGEWGGSVLLSMEWARSHSSRGFIASWPQFGVPCGLFLANLAVLAMSHIAGDEFMTWGWRVPFALSAILVVIGLWIRLGIMETPVFARLQRAEKLEQKPSVAVLSRHWREIILSAFARMGEQAPFYIFTAFVYSYAVGTLQIDRTLVLQAVLAAAVLEFVTIPYFGHLSDRIGRKRMYSLGAITVTFSGFHLFCAAADGLSNSRLHCHRAITRAACDALRTAGGFDCRAVPSTAALQRRLARLSTRLSDRRRSSAADRHMALRPVQVALCNCRLHRRVRAFEPRRCCLHARSHPSGPFRYVGWRMPTRSTVYDRASVGPPVRTTPPLRTRARKSRSPGTRPWLGRPQEPLKCCRCAVETRRRPVTNLQVTFLRRSRRYPPVLSRRERSVSGSVPARSASLIGVFDGAARED